MGYYYLISSLPMLKSDGDMPFSYKEFLDMCRSALSDSKFKILENLSLTSNTGPLVKEWGEFYCVLKEELDFQRNTRLGRRAQFPSIKDEAIAKLVSNAINNANPLVAEEMLLSFQFQKLDELVGLHYFDEAALFGYALKLKLFERKKSFSFDKGKAQLNNIINKLEQEITTMEQE